MNQIYFWQAIDSDPTRFLPYKTTIDTLSRGRPYPKGLNLEKLRLPVRPSIYSVRVNDATRLLLTKHKGKLIVLDVVENHDYHKSPFLRHRTVLMSFLEKTGSTSIPVEEVLCFDDEAADVEAAASSLSSSEPAEMIPLDYYNRTFLELDTNQESICHIKTLPLLVRGPAGTGKSCAALKLMATYLRTHQDDGAFFPIVYLTLSPELAQTMKSTWKTMCADETYDDLVYFESYQDRLKKHLGETGQPLSLNVERDKFQKWYNTYYKTQLKEASTKSAAASARKPKKKGKSLPTGPVDELPPVDKASLVWQEFRICSGHPSEETYIALGKNHSAVDKGIRPFIWAAYQAYLRHISFSPTLHPLPPLPDDESRPKLMVIDEAQDLSGGQIEGLYSLVGGEVAVFCGEQQSLEAFIPPSLHLNDLVAGAGGPIIALNAAYRSSNQVVAVANQLIELKRRVTRGVLDKKEAREIPMAADPSLAEGSAFWVDPATNPEALDTLNKKADDPDFAVVTWSEHLDEAKATFATQQVFSIEKIKGREYKTIVFYRPLDHKDSRLANEEIATWMDLERAGKATATAHLPKTDHDTHTDYDTREIAPFFDGLHTGVTRAMETLVMVQSVSRHQEAMASALKPLFTTLTAPVTASVGEASSDEPIIATTPSSAEPWLAQALLLAEDLDKRDMAKAILIERLGWHEATVDEWFATLPKQTPPTTTNKLITAREKLKTRLLVGEDLSNLHPPLLEKTATLIVSTDKKGGIETSLFYFLLTDPEGQLALLRLIDTAPHVVDTIPTMAWSTIVKNGPYVHCTALFLLTKSDTGLTLLETLFKTLYPTTVEAMFENGVLSDALVKTTDTEGDTSLLYALTTSAKGTKVLQQMIQHHPTIIEQLPVIAWLKTNDTGTNVLSNLASTPFGCGMLITLIGRSPATLHRILKSADKAYISLLICTLASTPFGSEALKALIEVCPSTINRYTKEAWSTSYKIPNASIAVTPLSLLSTNDLGQKTLLALVKNCPSLASQLPKEAWTAVFSVTEGSEDTCFLNWLLHSEAGQHGLAALREKCPLIMQNIPIPSFGLLLSRATMLGNTSLMQWLRSEGKGQDTLRDLLKTYPKIINAIPSEYWTLAPSTEGRAYSSFLHWLIKNPDILEILITKYPNIIQAIPVADWFLSPLKQEGKKQEVSPQKWLKDDPKGRQCFELLITETPDYIKKMLEDTWTSLTAEGESSEPTYMHWLTGTPEGRTHLLNNLALFVSIIPGPVWAEVLPGSGGKNALILLAECEQGQEILIALFQTFPYAVRAIPAEGWATSYIEKASDGNQPNSAIHWLVANDKNRETLRQFIYALSDVIPQIPWRAWIQPLANNLTTLHRLAISSEAIDILVTIIRLIPPDSPNHFVHHIPEILWTTLYPKSESYPVFKATILDFLADKKEGLDIIVAFILHFPTAIRSIPRNAWAEPCITMDRPHGTITPLYELINQKDGLALLHTMLEYCPDVLFEIPIDVWTREVADGSETTSLLKELKTEPECRAIFRIMQTKIEALPPSESATALKALFCEPTASDSLTGQATYGRFFTTPSAPEPIPPLPPVDLSSSVATATTSLTIKN